MKRSRVYVEVFYATKQLWWIFDRKLNIYDFTENVLDKSLFFKSLLTSKCVEVFPHKTVFIEKLRRRGTICISVYKNLGNIIDIAPASFIKYMYNVVVNL